MSNGCNSRCKLKMEKVCLELRSRVRIRTGQGQVRSSRVGGGCPDVEDVESDLMLGGDQ